MKLSAKISIQGTGILLFHAFKSEVLSEKVAKSGTTGNYKEEWKMTVIMDENRNLYLPNSYILAPFKEGAKYMKVGKGNLSKKLISTLLIPATKIFLDGLKVPEEKDLLMLDTEPVYLDVRPVVNPATKGRNLRYRIACKKGWTCSFIIEWDDYVISKENMKVCAENAGMFSGTGDGRSIGFGRFEIKKFEIIG
jgi:hypothetical protein